jgi:hypothetical protein
MAFFIEARVADWVSVGYWTFSQSSPLGVRIF